MIYRPEHPKPQFMRENWLNLNGEWQFEVDNPKSGLARGFADIGAVFSQRIQVPFCPESKLSGIENVDFMYAVWYKRDFTLTQDQLAGNVRLHIGAADYATTVFINGQECGTHKGGYVSFTFDITAYVKAGSNTVTVYVTDDTRDPFIPSGKQCGQYHSFGCYYTRTTGIWQTVWLEFIPKTHIISARYTTDPDTGVLNVHAKLQGKGTLHIEASFGGTPMGSCTLDSNGGDAFLSVPLAEKHLWEIGCGNLYDLVLTYGEDTVKSYFGLRSLQLDGHRFRINGKSVFQRLVLDQGFYPDGIYTAPSDGELLADIQRSIAMGFNGARLHEKVCEERFLYHCDRMGYIVWGEYPNWGLDHTSAQSIYGILPEWLEEVERDYNHPSIVGWCPFNETWDLHNQRQCDDVLALVYQATKAADPTRPCIDTSGNYHVVTDIYDLHDYEQNPAAFAEHYAELGKSNKFGFWQALEDRQHYDGVMPFFVSEYGGIRWSQDQNGWGYGQGPATEEEFLARLKGLTDVLLDNPRMFGFCYTQLTDVEQEQNGLYTYDRQPKFDPATVTAILARKAAIEEE